MLNQLFDSLIFFFFRVNWFISTEENSSPFNLFICV